MGSSKFVMWWMILCLINIINISIVIYLLCSICWDTIVLIEFMTFVILVIYCKLVLCEKTTYQSLSFMKSIHIFTFHIEKLLVPPYVAYSLIMLILCSWYLEYKAILLFALESPALGLWKCSKVEFLTCLSLSNNSTLMFCYSKFFLFFLFFLLFQELKKY